MESGFDVIFLDTHVVIWLHQGCLDEFSKDALESIEKNDLFISPMVILEMQYLREVGRVRASPDAIVKYLEETIGLTVSDVALQRLVQKGLGQSWTRDPFDRLIVAHAQIERSSLLTRDKMILKHYSKAFW